MKYLFKTDKQQFFLCVCVFVLRPLSFPTWGNREWAVNSEYKIDQADITEWISFLPSTFMEEVSPDLEATSAKSFISME